MREFILLTLNLRHGQGGLGQLGSEKEWSFFSRPAAMRENAAKIGEYLAHSDPLPDIFCLQESNAAAPLWPDIVPIIRRALPRHPYCAVCPNDILPHNNFIISRFPFRKVVSKQFGWPNPLRVGFGQWFLASLNRGYVAVAIDGIGFVVNTHLQPYDERIRLAEAEELQRDLWAVWNAYGGHVVLAGDLNAETYDDPALMRLVAASGTGYGFSAEPPLSQEHFSSFATWPDGTLGRRMRTDYILVSPAKTIRSVSRLSTGLSDHLAVLAAIA